MGTVTKTRSELIYWKRLLTAGWEGASSGRRASQGAVSTPRPVSVYGPVAVGAVLGLVGAGAMRKGRSKSTVALGGAVGTAVGLGASLAWTFRHVTQAAARAALRRVSDARDAHWLELNPINYA